MARKGKGKGNASTPKAASSEVNNAAKTAQVELQASTPMEVEGAENGENATEVTNLEGDGNNGMHREENAVEEEVNGGTAAEKRVEEDNCVDNGQNAVEEVNEGDEAEKQGEEDSCLNKQGEEDSCLIKQGENAVEEEFNDGNETENEKEDTCVDKEKIEEDVLGEEVNGGNAADKQEGNCVDEEKNVENVDMYEGKSEECTLDLEENNRNDLLGETEAAKENKGNVGEKNEDQDAVEEEINEDNKTEQHVVNPEGNLEQQNIKTRKRNRGKNKPKWPRRKKIKKGNNGAEQVDKIEENDAHEINTNNDDSLDENKGKEKVAVDVEDGGENVKEKAQKEVGESSKKKVIDLRNVTRRSNVAETVSGKLTSKSKGKKGSPLKKAKTMGMIFMCSSATKQDCYRYKVLGLPASKRNLVESIYKGMRLFLYDVDLKMLYGIYKAAGRGGYNIEPKAFNSQFPSQVRFIISEDCLPLAEEKFKVVIKDNYFTKSKFDCQLNSEQVKNLCKLFETSGKASWLRTSRGRARGETKKLDRGRIGRRDEVRRPSLKDKGRQQGRSRVRSSPVAPLHRLSGIAPSVAASSAYERAYLAREPPIERREFYSQSRLSDVQDTVREPYIERPDIHRQGQLLDYHDSYRREPLLESRYALSHEPLLESRDSLRHEPLLESRDSLRRRPVEGRGSLRHEPLLESRGTLRREPLLESRDTLRREPLLEGRDLRREPLLESRDSLRREPLLVSRDTMRREPLLEGRDTLRREPLLESRDTLRPEVVRNPYRREPPLEYRDSYREERLLGRDLYRQEARLDNRDRPLLNLEPRRRSENENRDIHSIYREPPSYNDRVYSTNRPAEYQPTSRAAEYHQPTTRATEYQQRVEMPSRGLTVAYRSSAGISLDYYSRRPAN